MTDKQNLMPPRQTARRLLQALLVCACLPGPVHAVCNTASIAAEAPDSRYAINGETVTDLWTGLIWKRCVEGLSGNACATGVAGTYTWQGALNRSLVANGALSAGFADWRVPNRNELASLVERRCGNPAINATVFPNTPSSGSWTGSTNFRGADGSLAWQVDFNAGEVLPLSKSTPLVLRLVRGGP